MITKIGICRDLREKKPWIVRWFGEYDSKTGKRRHYSKSFRLKIEAEDFQVSMRQKIKLGVPRTGTECQSLVLLTRGAQNPAIGLLPYRRDVPAR